MMHKQESTGFSLRYEHSNSSDEEQEQDQDLKIAIQLSLQDQQNLVQDTCDKGEVPTKNKEKEGNNASKKQQEWGWYLNKLPAGFSKNANNPSVSVSDIVVESIGKPPATMRLRKPKLPLQWGVHHGKMFVLFYGEFVRVAISTANLIMIDYERKSQGIWLQDFPKKDKSKQGASSGDFEDTLCDYVQRLGEPDFIKLKQYDFSSATVVLVTSVPGYHKDADKVKYGHMKVRTVLEKEKVHEKFKNSPIACQFSSLGSITEPWLMGELAESFSACGGFYSDSTPPTKTEKGGSSSSADSAPGGKGKKRSRESNNIQVIWPTEEFVRNSIDGWGSGGSLCFPHKNLKPFFKEKNLFHCYMSLSGREKVPPHIKTYTRYTTEGNLAWFYLTSANLSKAAMGELQKGDSQFMIRHYEIGENWRNTTEPIQQSDSVVCMPVPYILPPLLYKANDTPWIWDVPHNEPDIFGRAWKV